VGVRSAATPSVAARSFRLLSNRLYVGEIVHKDQTYPGLHAAIIDRETFEAAQMLLACNAGPELRSKAGVEPLAPKAPLAGLVFDDAGNRMTPIAARKGKVAIGPEGAPAVDTAKRIDLPLLRALIKAETWKARLEEEGITMDALAAGEGVHRAYAQRVVRLAWLSPTLKRAILEGATPTGFTLKRLLQVDIPLVWRDQNWWL